MIVLSATDQKLQKLLFKMPSAYVLFCSLAVLDPRVGHTMDVLSPFVSVLCHSDWLFHGESCPRLDVVHPSRAWSSSPACTRHCSLHYLFLQAVLKKYLCKVMAVWLAEGETALQLCSRSSSSSSDEPAASAASSSAPALRIDFIDSRSVDTGSPYLSLRPNCQTLVWDDTIQHDMIRDAILTCAQKLTWVSFFYRTERTTKSVKQKN